MLTTEEGTISDIFSNAAGGRSVEKVKKIRDYAFVHFRSREDAICALDVVNGKRALPEDYLVDVT